MACKSNNNLPDGIWYNRVITMGDDPDAALLAAGGINNVASDSDYATGSGATLDIASGTYPDNLAFGYLPATCQHCLLPACASVCPVDAITQEDTGIISTDNELCIGCEECIDACPYKARSFNWEEPTFQTEFPLGDVDAPAHTVATQEKCTFCANRIERGEAPACMELCLGRCRFWGDIDDPASEVSTYIAGKETFSLLAGEGTNPSTLYIR